MSRSSRDNARSNLWSGSVVIWSASSLRSVDKGCSVGEGRMRKREKTYHALQGIEQLCSVGLWVT